MSELCLNKLILSTQWLYRNTPKQTLFHMCHIRTLKNIQFLLALIFKLPIHKSIPFIKSY